MDPKYPDITVHLSGKDGNAFAILARVCRALAQAGREKGEIAQCIQEATRGDYDNVLRTCIQWVDVE